jgi:hypothetical protein
MHPPLRVRRTALRVAVTALLALVTAFGLAHIAPSQTRLTVPAHQASCTTAWNSCTEFAANAQTVFPDAGIQSGDVRSRRAQPSPSLKYQIEPLDLSCRSAQQHRVLQRHFESPQ